jgi:hypothetical protein
MPRAAETDPAKLAQRLERRRSFARERNRRHRSKVKERTEAMLNQALATFTGEPADPDSLNSPKVSPAAERTARAVLRRVLSRRGVTLDNVVSKVAEALSSQKVRLLGGKEVSLVDTGNRLRASDIALKLLERVGTIPSVKEAQVPQAISVSITLLNQGDTIQRVPLVATPTKTIDATVTPPRPTRNVVTGSAAHEARLKREAPYELPEAAEGSGK